MTPSPPPAAEEKPFSALIVDDTPIIQILLRRALSAYPVECEVASSGREALERFEQRLQSKRPYDLVCLDVGLPEMDGSAALPLMRAAESRLGGTAPAYIVVLTGDDSEETVKAMRAGGANAYFLKPLDRSAFVNQLWKALSQKSTASGASGTASG